jgi:hypothetical protein
MRIAGVALLTAISLNVFAAEEDIVRAARVATPPILDGVVTPEEYPMEPVTEFTEWRPETGVVPENRTEVYVVYDEVALYVGWVCFEKNIDGLVASRMVRDSYLNEDDCINLMVDANNDKESSYDFMVNCRGCIYDGTVAKDGEVGGSDWDGVWDAKTSIAEDRWYCEMRIPWENFVYSADTETMGIQFFRDGMATREDTYWAGEGNNFSRVSTFGTLAGLEGLKSPKRFSFLPYGTLRGEQYPNEKDFIYDGGIDIGFKGGKPFNVNVTVNPDYAQIEADSEEINLEPSDIYLTEKRPYFTEATTTFASDFDLLYTRKMTNVLAGGKITGTAGPVTYGVLDVQLESDDPRFPDDNVSAARVKTAVYEASYIGGMAVTRAGRGAISRDGDLSDYNVVGYIDANLAFPYDFGLSVAAAKSKTNWRPVAEPGTSGKDYSYIGNLLYNPNPTTNVTLNYVEQAENYQADMSFDQLYHRNRRSVGVNVVKGFQINKGPVREIEFSELFLHWWRLDTGASIRNYWCSHGSLTFSNNSFTGVYVDWGYDGRFYGYGVPTYDIKAAGGYIGSGNLSWGRLFFEYWRGENYGARYNDFYTEFSLIPFSKLQFGLNAEVVDPIYGAGEPDYGTEADDPFMVVNAKVVNRITDDLYWRAILRGNSEFDVYLASGLVGWTYLPGSTLYVAFEEQRDNSTGSMDLLDRRLFVKISYLISI